MTITKYPDIITERNFHWTNKQWEEEIRKRNIDYYGVSCDAIRMHGYPDITKMKFHEFSAKTHEELTLHMYIRICSCLYAIETGYLTDKEAFQLIYKLQRGVYTALAHNAYVVDASIVNIEYF
jgi:hypothetical protein